MQTYWVKQVHVSNCDTSSVTSNNHKLETDFDSITEHEPVKVNEQNHSDGNLFTDMVFCLEKTTTYIFFGIEQMRPA